MKIPLEEHLPYRLLALVVLVFFLHHLLAENVGAEASGHLYPAD